jgi:hypothetical protein
MQGSGFSKRLRGRITYANVMSTIAVFLCLGGATAVAANTLGKNSVGPRQLKANSVTTGKLANNSVNSAKVVNGSITGSDINIGGLPQVPSAAVAASAGNANTVGTHAAACPSGTTLIRGYCFDTASNPVVATQNIAAEGCAARGGWLPSPEDLYTVRGVLNLGTGVGNQRQYTNEVYANTEGSNYSTVVVDGTGAITEQAVNQPARYTCVYPLVR